jgi:fructokinase
MLATAPDECAVIVDVNSRPSIVPDRERHRERVRRVLGAADAVKVSDEDLAYLAPSVAPLAAARGLLHDGPRAVLLTSGASAVHVLTAHGEATVPVPPVAVVDTIGAGDSFGGGLLAYWQLAGHGRSDLASLDRLVPGVEAAIAVAGVVCGRRGAEPPWRHELPRSWSPGA